MALWHICTILNDPDIKVVKMRFYTVIGGEISQPRGIASLVANDTVTGKNVFHIIVIGNVHTWELWCTIGRSLTFINGFRGHVGTSANKEGNSYNQYFMLDFHLLVCITVYTNLNDLYGFSPDKGARELDIYRKIIPCKAL
jgi:hypothetical protein